MSEPGQEKSFTFSEAPKSLPGKSVEEEDLE
jgi:hypothetical protein